MVLRRLLGLPPLAPQTVGAAPPPEAETATIRRIVGQLEQLPAEQRLYLAGFAYVLGRAANADMTITAEETEVMENAVRDVGGLPHAHAILVVQIAKNQAELYGGTEDYLVTREFTSRATADQRRAVMESCFAVAASDHAISAEEYAELTEIGTELGLNRDELNEIRRRYSDQLTAIQQMRVKDEHRPAD